MINKEIYINKEIALDAISYSETLSEAFRLINNQKAADVIKVRHGAWINADEQPYFRKHYHTKVCSECGKRKDGKWLYCPYCGSKNQDGGKDNG